MSVNYAEGVRNAESFSWNQRLERFVDRNLRYILVAPALLLMLALIAYPLVFNVNLSLRDVSILNIRSGDWTFIGLRNYIQTLTNTDNVNAFVRTLIFLVATVSGELVIGIAAALVFNIDFRGKGMLMTLVLVPMMITPVAVGLMWRMLLNNEWGIINYYLTLFHLPAPVWLGDSTTALVSVILVDIWWGVSFVILVLLGGLAALPAEPFEAAAIDGANRWQTFRFLTLPMLSPLLVVVATIRAIDAFREFDIIYTLTQGGPADATRVYALQIYTTGFTNANFGLAAAQAMILFLIVMVLSGGLLRGLASTA